MTDVHTSPHQGQKVYTSGVDLQDATSALILVHGRGATAPSILELARVLDDDGRVFLAPQALGNTWYPNSFLAPRDLNEPGITSGLDAIADLISQIEDAGLDRSQIVLGGFSQGACLASEFVARNPSRFGGLLVFSGGLIGPPGTPMHVDGDLDGLPVFIGCSDTDFHIPLERVEDTATAFADAGAKVDKRIYPGMGHTIIQDEIKAARDVLRQVG